MPSHPLAPTTLMSVRLSATMTRHRYTADPDVAIAEMRQIAGEQVTLLEHEAGLWAGYHETNPLYAVLVDALKRIGAPDAIELGRRRRTAGTHSTR